MNTERKGITRSGLAFGRLKKLLVMAIPAGVVAELARYYFEGTLSYEVGSALVVVPVLDAVRKWLTYDEARADREASEGSNEN